MKKCIYCAVDNSKSIIKIGVTGNPTEREIALSSSAFKSMRILFLLEFANVHYEDQRILGYDDNYASSPVSFKCRSEYIGIPADKKAYKLETFFKKRLKEHILHGSEWFSYTENTLDYIKRMFIALSYSEKTALMRTRLYLYV